MPQLVKGIDSVKNVQCRARKLVPRLGDMTYKGRMTRLNLSTLETLVFWR